MTVDRVRRTPVAIVGIATIAPMAENTTRFWQNILDKVDAITEVPPSRWAISDYYDPDPTTPDRTYSKVGGFLPEIPFDPLEFGIPPNILEVIDTSQLLSLVTARRVLEDAGYLDAPSAVRDRTGVILGVGGGQTLIGPLLSRLQHPVLEQILRSVNLPQEQIDTLLNTFSQAYVPWEENAFPGLLGNVIAGRITNRLDLGGINCVVDAACASSISAIKMAVSELQEGNADMMISGGVDTDTSPFMYLSFSKTPALSKHGRSRPFDESADGMLLGEAIAMFCLKRLDDAERDGDRIYAVIRGVGASSDGRAKSIYAPSASGQVVAMRRAYEDAGISPESVDIIEAHGTGTARGDATELESVATLLNDYGVGPKQVAVGSVKSQVGHTKAAAGGVSLAKMALALHHKILPPTINVENPNPALHEPGNPLYVNTEARPWIRRHHPRRAGLSSFGFGGTNFHMVLEEYTSASSETPAFRHRLHTTPRIVILHAKNPSELAGMIEHHLTAETTLAALVALYDATPIPADHARLGFVAVDDDEAIEKLQKALDQLRTNTDHVNWKPGQGIFYRQMATTGKLVALFPGQGSQYVNMGRDLLNQFPHLQHIMERFDDAYPDGRLSEIVYPPPSFDDDSARTQSSQLMQTENAQPALGAMSMMLYALLRDAGFQPDMTAGHSFGELTALWAADALTDDDFIQLAIARGQAMKAHPGMDSGQMAAVIGDVAMLETHLQGAEGVHIANHNSQRQAVIAGARDKLAAATPQLEQTGYRVIPLSVSAAFHTPLVQHAQAAFAAALENVTLHPPRTDVYANSTAGLYPHAEDAIQQLLTEHILKSVRFREQIEAIYEDGGRIFVEIGPRNVLTRLLKDILPHGTYDVIAPDVDSKQGGNQHLHEAVAKLMVLGVNLQNFDRYAPTTNDIASEPSPLNVMLSGSNYVSARTQNAYETQLNQNRTMAFTSVDANVPETNMEENQPVMPSDTPPSRGKTIDAHHLFLEMQRDLNDRLTTLYAQAMDAGPAQSTLVQQLLQQLAVLQEQNRDVIQTHMLYMRNGTGSDVPDTVTSHEASSQPAPSIPAEAASDSEKDPLLAQFLHDASHNGHQQRHKNGLRLSYDLPPPPAPQSGEPPEPVAAPQHQMDPVPAPSMQAPAPAADIPEANVPLLEKLLGIVSEKTGYPVDLLEPAMSLEADLGIDSIKRVEILGVMQDTVPGLPPLKPDEMAQLNTLGEIADYIQGQIGTLAPTRESAPVTHAPAVEANSPIMPPPIPTKPPPTITAMPEVAVTALTDVPAQPTTSTDDMLTTLLGIVSEKTGYPVDLLEPAMSLEADLGIDSIKRVEILGVMQDTVPGLPPLKPDEMARLNTLGEIAEYVRQQQTVNFSHGEGGVLPSSPAEFGEVLLRNVVLTRLPQPDRLLWSLPAHASVLITDDGSTLVDEMVKTLQTRQWNVVRLALPGIMNHKSPYQLSDHSEDAIEKALDAITTDHGAVTVFIHVVPQTDNDRLTLGGEAKDRAKLAFFLTKHLHEPLHAAAQDGRAVCLFVTRTDGRLGTSGTVSDVVGTGLSGFIKTVALEWQYVFCRLVDVDMQANDGEAAQYVLAELDDPDTRHREIGYAGGIRRTLSMEPYA